MSQLCVCNRAPSARAVSPRPAGSARPACVQPSSFFLAPNVGRLQSAPVAASRPATASVRRSRAVAVRAEISYVMVKPDGVQRGLVGEIISRFEKKGFKIKALKMFQCTKDIAEEHYKDLSSKPFFNDLVQYILSGPVVCMVLEGDGVVKSARKLIGATNPLEAEPGTVRGDFAVAVGRNVVHGSDSPENGKRETGLWFNEAEICEWDMTAAPWLLE